MGVARQPARRIGVAVERGAVDLVEHPSHQVVAKPGHVCRALGLLGSGPLDGQREAGDRGRVDRAGADVALLPSAVQHRHQVDLGANDQCADAHRTAELVT